MKRVSFCKSSGQFLIVPTLGVTWGASNCKFAIVFTWLNFGIVFRFGIIPEYCPTCGKRI